jgi:hypothetical protein
MLPEVNHIDKIRNNNKVSNLEWISSRDNKRHSVYRVTRTPTNKLRFENWVRHITLKKERNKQFIDSIKEKLENMPASKHINNEVLSYSTKENRQLNLFR